VEDEFDISCTDVLKLWLNMEAEPMPEAPREAGGIMYQLGKGGKGGF